MLAKRFLYLPPTFRRGLFPVRKSIDSLYLSQVFSITNKARSTLVNIEDNQFKNKSIPKIFGIKMENLLNKQNLIGSDLVFATKSLLKLCNKQNLTLQLHQNKLFKDLHIILKLHKEKLKVEEIIQILNIFINNDIKNSRKIIAFILNCVSNSLHKFTLQNLKTLSEIISKIPESKATEIKQKLNNCILIKLKTNFDQNNLDFLVNALYIACFNWKSDEKSIEMIIDMLQNMNIENTSISNIVVLMKACIHMDYYPLGMLNILQCIQTILKDNINNISIEDMNCILEGITGKVKNGFTEFYDESFLDNCASKLIKEDAGFVNSIPCLNYFNQLKHTNKLILSYICIKYYETKYLHKTTINQEFEKICILACGLAFSKYKPFYWKEIQNAMHTQNMLKSDFKTKVKFCLHLACLDSYNKIVLKNIFKTNSCIKNTEYRWAFLALYQKIKTLADLTQSLPSLRNFELFRDLHESAKYSLLSTLQSALGGPMYVKVNLKSRLYHHIDYAVVFRDEEYPVAINNVNDTETKISNQNPQYLEDLKISSNCQIIAILDAPDTWYSRNECHLLGPFSMYIETLEALSYKVITVSENAWKELPERSKIPYIMNQLHSKLCYREKVK